MNTTMPGPSAGDGGFPVRVSVGLYPYDRWSGVESMLHAASLADRLGYHAVTFPEHVIWPVTEDEPRSVVWYDNFVLAATLAAATSRIRLLFNACVVPYRHPVPLAKSVATLDVVSRGRVVLVAGTGWMRREFQMLGVPFDERGPRTDDALRAMKALWTADRPSYTGEYFSIPPVHFAPTCVQQPHVPIWVGGNGRRVLRRAVELGDGWSPLGGTIDDVSRAIAELRDGLDAAGRDNSAFTYGFVLPFGEREATATAAIRHLVADDGRAVESTTASVEQTVDMIGRCRASGVNHFVVQFAWQDPREYEETLERFAGEVMGQFGSPGVATRPAEGIEGGDR
jgi:probable F420-dependent oxidoreductase